VGFERVGLDLLVESVNLIQKRLPLHDAPGAHCQRLQNQEFAPLEVNWLPVNAKLPVSRIVAQIRAADRRLQCSARPAESRVDSCDQFVRIKRLSNVIVRSCIEAADLFGRCVESGQHDNSDVGTESAQSRDPSDTVAVWQTSIENSQRIRARRRRRFRVLACNHSIDDESGRIETLLERAAQKRVVLDQKA